MDKTLYAYNKNARRYADKFMGYPSYRRILEQFADAYINPGASVLDIGCGPGHNARLILDRIPRTSVTGIDLSESMLAIAKPLVPEANFCIMDMRDMAFPTCFEAIIASFCIVHLTFQETTAFLTRAAKTLSTGGSLYLSFMEGRQSGFETTSFSDDELFYNYFPRQDILDLLAKEGLEIIGICDDDYAEPDGSLTRDVFVFAHKPGGA